MKQNTAINKRNFESGAALVEFALVVPLLLLFLFGIIEFSVILYDNAIITNASREAAREWIEFTPFKDTQRTKAILDTIVQDYTQNRLISLGATGNPPTTSYMVNNVPTVNTHIYDSADLLSVSVDYQYDFLFLPGFVEGLMSNLTLSAETVMKAE
jgi:hypothetical protein